MADDSAEPVSLEHVVRDVIRRRLAGEPVSADEVCARHPDLEPDLSDTLGKLDRIDRARREVARERGAAGDDAPLVESFAPRLLIDGYTVLREISRGGQAVVYLARHEASGRQVAVKVLRDGVLADERQRQRFERESRILSELNHPNIVALFDRGRTRDGQMYLAMDYIAGATLAPEEMARSVPPDQRLALFATVCRAVDAAHARGIVHRDLKPSNIRIDDAGRPHVLDFGLALSSRESFLRESMTATGQFLGSYLWASPEQAEGRSDVTPAADVFSLGVILHQLLAGGRFPANVHAVVRRAIEPGTPARGTSPTRFPAVERRSLWPVLAKCLATDPSARYPTAGALADAVERAPQTDPLPPRPAIPYLLAVVALLLGVATWGAAKLVSRARHAPPRLRADERLVQNGRPVIYLEPDAMLVWIPPGEALLGTPPGQAPRLPDEVPHTVRFPRGFYMLSTEVSQGLYERVTSRNPSRFRGLSLPVERVTYHDAVEFCRLLSASSGRHFRLPTEDEWEYACRAGSTTQFHFGDDPLLMQRYGNGADQSNTDPDVPNRAPYDDGHPYTSSVYFLENRWGLRDVHGNVWEWCAAPYLSDPTNPATAVRDRAPARGGSWYDGWGSLRSAHRNPLPPDFRNDNLGFRIVMDADPGRED